jgi:hypothetical protein
MHAGAIAEDVQDAFGRFGGRTGMGTERVDNEVQFPVVEVRATCRSPHFGFVSAGSEDRLRSAVQGLFDVEAIKDLDGLWKQLPGSFPDPGEPLPSTYLRGERL